MDSMKKWQRIDHKTCIYALIDPVTGFVRYIGKTTQKSASRFNTHICHAKKPQRLHAREYWVTHWIRSLLRDGLKPEMIELEIVERFGDWAEAECFWIDVMRSWGFDLCNVRAGGQAGNFTKQSAATIEKRVSKLRGRPGRKKTEQEKIIARANLARGRETVANWPAERKLALNAAKAARLLGLRRVSGNAHHAARAVWIDGEKYDTVSEAFRRLKVTRRTIYNWLRDGAAFYVDEIKSGDVLPTLSEFRARRAKKGRPVGLTLIDKKKA